MAKKVNNPTVGLYVYRPYQAQNPGKIKKILPKGTQLTSNSINLGGGINVPLPPMGKPVEVAWLDGTTTIEDSFHLSDFDALIKDHKKKLNTHTSKLKALGSL